MWLVGVVSMRWVWLLGVVVRRYIDFLILLIPTPLVSVLFCSSIPTFCSFFNVFVLVLYRTLYNLCRYALVFFCTYANRLQILRYIIDLSHGEIGSC